MSVANANISVDTFSDETIETRDSKRNIIRDNLEKMYLCVEGHCQTEIT